MKRFWDYNLTEEENEKMETMLKKIPTFEEFNEGNEVGASGIPLQEDIDEYEHLYGDIIRAARDAVTE